jgi:hypothetical protein
MNALLFNVNADKSFLHYLDFVDIVNFSHSHKASLFILKDNTLLRSLVYARCDIANITPNLDISKVMLDLYYQFKVIVMDKHDYIPRWVNAELFRDDMIRRLYLLFITSFGDSQYDDDENEYKLTLYSDDEFNIPICANGSVYDENCNESDNYMFVDTHLIEEYLVINGDYGCIRNMLLV